eukprot:1158591-Pelagomonas_calceolata.AAC.7
MQDPGKVRDAGAEEPKVIFAAPIQIRAIKEGVIKQRRHQAEASSSRSIIKQRHHHGPPISKEGKRLIFPTNGGRVV